MAATNPKQMIAKYHGTCASCGEAVTPGQPIYWQKVDGRSRVMHRGNDRCHDLVIAKAKKQASAIEVERAARRAREQATGSAPGHGNGCQGTCDGMYDCTLELSDYYSSREWV